MANQVPAAGWKTSEHDQFIVRDRKRGRVRDADVVHKSYGHGLPPAGPANELVTTPSLLPFPRHEESVKGKEGR